MRFTIFYTKILEMNFIKKYVTKKYVAENKPVRDIVVTSLQKAKRVGILCKITDEDSYKDIYAVFSSIQSADRSVNMLGYIDDKEVPFYCLQQFSADYFCNKDLNWYGKPEKVQIHDFMNLDFDILIDFTHEPVDVIRLILSLSPAHFIVGSAPENKEFYDLIISSESPLSNAELLKNIDLYTKNLTGGGK